MNRLKFSLALLFVFATYTISFAHDFEVDGIYYNINDDWTSVSVTYKGDSYYSYTNEYSGNIVIPSEVTYYGNTYSVTSIGGSAFSSCSGLTSITIPNSVTSIGGSAFSSCSGLTKVEISDIAAWCKISFSSITSNPLYYAKHLYLNGNEVTNLIIPNSVTSIGGYAFNGCSGLTSITIPNTVTSIGTWAFSRCTGLTSITIPNSVTSIGNYAFEDCTGLTSITIPNSVIYIGNGAFSGCSELTSVVYNSEKCGDLSNDDNHWLYNCSYIKSFTIGENVKTIPANLCYGMLQLKSIIIPNSVTSIRNGAFSNCNKLTSVIFNAEKCNSLSSDWLEGSAITSFTIGENIKAIPANLCYGLSKLTSVTIPNSVTTIGGSAFYGCSGLTSVTIPNSVTSIGDYAFYNCSNLIKSAYPDNLSNPFSNGTAIAYPSDGIIDENGFIYDKNKNTVYFAPLNIRSFTIPNSVTSIGNYAFYNCSGLTSITIPNSVSSIGDDAFSRCSGLTFVNIPNSVTSIGNYAFYNCSGLTSVTMGNSVTSIGYGAFSGCSGLTSVTIPNSVTYIGSSAFYGTPFYNNMPNGVIYLNSVLYKYKGTMPNNRKIDINDGTISISPGAFYDCSGLTSITIPNSVSSIGDDAFSRCSGLTSVTIGNSVTSIGDHAFYGCSGLSKVEISDIAAWCNISFGDSSSNPLIYAKHLYLNGNEVTNIVIPNSVTSIGSIAFYNCSGLTSVTIPNSVTSIGNNAFYGCSNLIKSAYPDHLTNPFENGIAIAYPSDGIIDENGIIYDKNKNIVYFAPLNISSVSIPNSVTSIGNSAFYNCNNLEAIIIPKSVTSIGVNSFYGCSKANCLYLIEDLYLASKVKPCKSRYGSPIVCKQKGYENWKQFVNYTVNGNNITLSGNGCTLTSATMNNVTFEAIDNEININNYSAGTNNPLMIKGTFFGCDFETELSLFDIEYEITKQTYNNVWLTAKIISNYTKYNAEYKFENENVTGGVDFYIPASVLGLSADYFVTRISEINPEIGINDIYVKPNAISLKGTYKYLEDANYTVFRFQEDIIGSEAVFMGLTPNTTYTYDFSFETEEDGTFTVRKDYTTPSLTFDVLPAQVVNERKVLIRANTNGVDDALRFGFEWRRYDAPVEMPSSKSPCPVVEGVMYGALNNLSANTYYKFRPYYKSDDGNIFYGDWVAFYSGDAAAYFEPMVYTSGATEVRADVAQVKGVVVAGSDEILEQGFEYWDSANNGNKQTATSSGTLMNVELRNLAPKTTYYYRAYAKTVKGNTYGTELSFTTEASAGIDEVYAEGENITILGYYNLQGLRFDEPQNGLNIILYSNGMTKKLYIHK